MNKLWIIIAATLLLATGCNKDSKTEVPAGAEADVEMRLNVPVSYGSRSTDSEETISTLDILVFDGDEFLYRRHAYPRSTELFRATLKLGQNQTLYFFANCRDFIEAVDNTVLIEGKSWVNDIRPALIDTNTGALTGRQSGLPMWGLLDNVTIADVPVNDFGKVTLLRSVASVDVSIGVPESDFRMTSCYVYFAPNKGYLSSTKDNLAAFAADALQPESPAQMKTDVTLHSTNVVDNKIAKTLYLYDNPATASSGDQRYSRVVIGGKYNGSATETYYALDFLDAARNISKVTRNHKYIFIITGVNGEGDPDPGVASENKSVNMEAEIIQWNEFEDSDIYVDGSRYISIESKYCKIHHYANSSKTLRIASNIAATDWQLNFADATNGTQQELANGAIKNDLYQVSFVMGSDGTPTGIKVTAFNEFTSNGTDYDLETIKVKTRNIQFSITVSRTDVVENHWGDGGEQEWELGK